MPTIKITTCKGTSNYNALNAVSAFILANYQQRTYHKERDIVVSNRKVKVRELAKKSGMSLCSCNFKVTMIGPCDPQGEMRRVTGDQLAALLVSTGVVQAGAVEDPQGYDGGETMDAINRVAERLSV